MFSQAAECSSKMITSLQTYNRRTLNPLSARAFFYYSFAHEHCNRLAEIRPYAYVFLLLVLWINSYRSPVPYWQPIEPAASVMMMKHMYIHPSVLTELNSCSWLTTCVEPLLGLRQPSSTYYSATICILDSMIRLTSYKRSRSLKRIPSPLTRSHVTATIKVCPFCIHLFL